MEHKKQIALYLSGFADIETEGQTENELLQDAGFLESFIEAVEQRLYTVSSDFAGSVMRLLPNSPAIAITVPVLSRKMCAAVCFCSAAAIMLFTVSGFDRQILEYVAAQSGKLSEWITFVQNLTIGG